MNVSPLPRRDSVHIHTCPVDPEENYDFLQISDANFLRSLVGRTTAKDELVWDIDENSGNLLWNYQ